MALLLLSAQAKAATSTREWTEQETLLLLEVSWRILRNFGSKDNSEEVAQTSKP